MSDTEETHEEVYYPTTKVAATLGLTTETIRDWITLGKIKAVKIHGYWRVPRSEVIRIANDRHG